MNTLSIARPGHQLSVTCTICSGTFESCRCGARPGLVGDDQTRLKAFHRLVQHLRADGDRRAARAGRQARRTLVQMNASGEGK